MPNEGRSPAVAAILLAAGLSRRMGGENKLLLTVEGEPMVRRAARTLLASQAQSLTVVLGHQGPLVADALTDLPATLAVNAHYEQGQMSSVRAGLERAPSADHYLIALADQPSLMSGDIDRLIDAAATAPTGMILVPIYRGERGNPILMPASARADILAGGVNFGCKNLIRKNPERVLGIVFDTPAVLADIDTPEVYAALGEQSSTLEMKKGTRTWK
jgi:molybdenum cofactor cytidylyltransferase